MTGAGSRRGFTLIELLVVIAIIMFLMGVLAMGIPGLITYAKVGTTRTTLRAIESALGDYDLAFRRCPPDSRPGMTSSECLYYYLATHFVTQEVYDGETDPQKKASMVVATRTWEPRLASLESKYFQDLDSDGKLSIVDPWGSELIYDEAPVAGDYPAGAAINDDGYNLWSPGPDEADDRGAGDDVPRKKVSAPSGAPKG